MTIFTLTNSMANATTKSKTMRVSRLDAQAINRVMNEALENACSCNGSGTGAGYLGHERGCWVHIGRAKYRRVAAFLKRSALLE